MKTSILVPHIAYASNEQVAAVMHDTLAMIKTFDRVYRYLSGDLGDGSIASMPLFSQVETQYEEAGLTQDDYVREVVRALIKNIRVDRIAIARENWWFGLSKGGQDQMMIRAGNKFYKGSWKLTQFFEVVAAMNELSTPSTEEWKDYLPDLRYGLGDMVLATTMLLQIPQMCTAMANGDDIVFDAVYRRLASSGLKPAVIAKFLVEMRKQYYSVIPAFEECPQKWFDLCDKIPSVYVDSLIELEQYVWLLDFKAAENGDFDFNEEFISDLEGRAELMDRGTDIASAYPNEWVEFQKAVPKKYAAWIISLEPVLTIGLISPILKGNPFDEKYVNMLKEFMNKHVDAKENCNARTDHFSQD